MADYNVDIRDIKFVLFDQLDVDKVLSSKKFGDFSREDCEMILDEAYKFTKEVLAPANAPGDEQGCQFKDGEVTVPKAYVEPFKQYAEGGWIAISLNPEFGGQGAPESLRCLVADMFFGACISLNLGALLSSGAGHLIDTFGNDAQKKLYVENMYTGIWGGTMCLTEAQAGTDVGATRTKAIPEGDHYLIEGEKIFISFGDHDLTENIIHLLLARIEGAPSGTKGLSLFIVPKIRVNPDGSLGEPNDVECTGIEHKLGIHGSPTCTLSFGANGKCHGWLVGEANAGIKYMFQMMNEARLSVGLQGAAQANAAYQAALAFAKERIQSVDIAEFKNPKAKKVPIIKHPDVRVMLMRQKAYAEGLRALLAYTAYCIDQEICAAEENDREQFGCLVEILTPICKAYCSDMGFRVAEWALQTHGGYGYIKEYPAEQYLRDVKIASIYEGTNGIQALDLVGRKLGAKSGANLFALAGMVSQFLDDQKDHPFLKPQVEAVLAARDTWSKVNTYFISASMSGNLLAPVYNATTYLSLCGDFLTAFFLLQQAVIAWGKLGPLCKKAKVDPKNSKALAKFAQENPEVRFLQGKLLTAQFFCASELPQVESKAASIMSGDLSAMANVWDEEVA
ncbi:MAG: acyl-CoA dehydrogenase [Pseudomonadota bacterium]